MKDQILADMSLEDSHRHQRLQAIDEDLCMLENAAQVQVTHKNLDAYAQELVAECVAKMHIDEQVRFTLIFCTSFEHCVI
jgi:seryl-tRNA(Sec) selenium transferase